MIVSRKPAAPARVVLLVGLLAAGTATAQDREPGAAKARRDAPETHGFTSRPALDQYYDEQFNELDRRRIADLTELARRQGRGPETEQTYQDIFNLAITRDLYSAAKKAADDYLDAGKGTPSTTALATFVNVMAAAGRSEYAAALQDLGRFLKATGGGPEAAAGDPDLIFAVGESFLQRLIRDGHYKPARQVCQLFVENAQAKDVKDHFAARLARIEMLGKPAPPLIGRDVDGQKLNLDDYKGKVVLVDFWATWAPPCVAALPTLNAMRARYRDRGLEIIGVNVDAAQEGVRDQTKIHQYVRRFLLGMRVAWPNLFDGRGEPDFAKEWGVTEIPANFLIDRDGKIIQIELVGDDLEAAVEKAVGGSKRPRDPDKTIKTDESTRKTPLRPES